MATKQFPFSGVLIAAAPEEAGVYMLWQDGAVIYIGRALGGGTTLRSRLVDHFSGREGACTRQATHYSWELVRDPAVREAQLLQEHQARHQRPPRCNAAA
jgi:excinuclease UvrABC nuclease subunit